MISLFLQGAFGFVSANKKPIAIIIAIIAIISYHKIQVNKSWHAGQSALIESQRKEAERRNANASDADRTSRECSADPECLRKDDGHRRD